MNDGSAPRLGKAIMPTAQVNRVLQGYKPPSQGNKISEAPGLPASWTCPRGMASVNLVMVRGEGTTFFFFLKVRKWRKSSS